MTTQDPESGSQEQPKSRQFLRSPPVKFSETVAAIICGRLSDGETLKAICRDTAMPGRATVYRWLSTNPQFNDVYTRARLEQMDTWADEIIEISDDGTTDYITKVGRNGVEYEAVDQEHIQRSRLRVDTRKFLMGKIAPLIYGERIESVVSGTVTVQHELSDKERMRRLALFLIEDQADGGEESGAVLEGEAVEVAAQAGAACELCGQYHDSSACPVQPEQ